MAVVTVIQTTLTDKGPLEDQALEAEASLTLTGVGQTLMSGEAMVITGLGDRAFLETPTRVTITGEVLSEASQAPGGSQLEQEQVSLVVLWLELQQLACIISIANSKV